MPKMVRDPHSGAIVFHLTPEEKAIKDLRGELESMKQELRDKLDIVDGIIKSKE